MVEQAKIEVVGAHIICLYAGLAAIPNLSSQADLVAKFESDVDSGVAGKGIVPFVLLVERICSSNALVQALYDSARSAY